MASIKDKKFLWILALVILVLIGLRFLPVNEWLHQAQHWIEGLGTFAPVAYVLLYVVTALFLIPGSLLTIGAAGIFSFWKAFAVVVIGANLAALAAFWLSRTYLRDRVVRWAEGNPKFAALDGAIGREGFKTVFLVRLSPVFPFTLLNYLLGLTTVRTSSYVLANLIGMLPGTFLYVYIGATARDALSASSGGVGAWQLVLRIVGLLATVAVVVLVTRSAKKALAQAEQESVEVLPEHKTFRQDLRDSTR
ncbi:MAG: TVP38/TMEM64 family protein [Acidobacteria bacterium]|nr:TVP38/TMEM64 family protein [Acidobacteriota bacterium]